MAESAPAALERGRRSCVLCAVADDAIVVPMATVIARIDPERMQLAVRRARDQSVMLDADLAGLYGLDVRVLNQAVRRNGSRFPHDFMFTLTAAEAKYLRSHSVILKGRRGAHRKYLPKTFTEEGVAMLSSGPIDRVPRIATPADAPIRFGSVANSAS